MVKGKVGGVSERGTEREREEPFKYSLNPIHGISVQLIHGFGHVYYPFLPASFTWSSREIV